MQRFWIPVHVASTLFFAVSLVVTWREAAVRRLLLVALASYIVMRVWSTLFFIPEMLAFQKVPPHSAPSTVLPFVLAGAVSAEARLKCLGPGTQTSMGSRIPRLLGVVLPLFI